MSDKVNKKVLLPRFILSNEETEKIKDLDATLFFTWQCPASKERNYTSARRELVKIISLIRDQESAVYEVPYNLETGETLWFLSNIRIVVKGHRIPVVELMENEVTTTSISYYIADTLRKVISLYIGREIKPTSIVFEER